MQIQTQRLIQRKLTQFGLEITTALLWALAYFFRDSLVGPLEQIPSHALATTTVLLATAVIGLALIGIVYIIRFRSLESDILGLMPDYCADRQFRESFDGHSAKQAELTVVPKLAF